VDLMRVSVSHTLDDLQRDLARGPVTLVREGSALVRRNVTEGRVLAQGFAREKSGPHGKAYFKRITDEMTGPMTGEYGPHDGGIPVGAGWRHGPPNTDLPRSADLIGPKLLDDARSLLDRIFWPGGDQ
jgi:hypothetical protein